MKKTFLFMAALIVAAWSQNSQVRADEPPTVSTAGIYMRYCTTTETDVNVTIASTMLPYEYGGNYIEESGTYPTIFEDKRGCDSIVTLNLSVNNYPFSVSGTKQVIFSRGNLQYQASTNAWRFALHQEDICGSGNANIGESYEGWIDLFGFGTSGYNTQPYSSTTNCGSYPSSSITDTYNDWGKYNAISNGGNKAGVWRTLTKDEWIYLIQQRDDYWKKMAAGTVNGRHGIILLPDTWNLPDGLTFSASNGYYSSNVYEGEDWEKMQTAGAIFLPCAGSREGTTMNNPEKGRYWSADAIYGSCTQGHHYRFEENAISDITNYDVCTGYSVRLVKDAE